MADRVTITTTTETAADVRAALGVKETTPPAASAPETKTPETVKTDTAPAETTPEMKPASDAAAPAATTDDTERRPGNISKRQARFNKVTAEKHKALQELSSERQLRENERQLREKAERELAELRAKAAAPADTRTETTPETAPVTADTSAVTKPRPKQEDFADFDEYEAARDAWLLEQSEAKATAKVLAEFEARQKAEDEARAQAAADADATARAKTFLAQQEAAKQKHPDYVEVVSAAGDMNLSGPMIDFMKRQPEVGAELAYYFATHQDVADEISQKPIADQYADLGALKARHELGTLFNEADDDEAPDTTETPAPAAVPKAAAVPAKTAVSKAPKPMTTLGGGMAETSKDPSQMSHAEYKAWFKKQFPGKR